MGDAAGAAEASEEGRGDLLQRELLFLLLHSLRSGPAGAAAAQLEAEAARLQLLPSFYSPFGARAADGSLPTHPQTYTQVRPRPRSAAHRAARPAVSPACLLVRACRSAFRIRR